MILKIKFVIAGEEKDKTCSKSISGIGEEVTDDKLAQFAKAFEALTDCKKLEAYKISEEKIEKAPIAG